MYRDSIEVHTQFSSLYGCKGLPVRPVETHFEPKRGSSDPSGKMERTDDMTLFKG